MGSHPSFAKMIAFTLYGCVLLALSPAAFAKDMLIGPDCDTYGQDGADWNAVSNSIYDLFTKIPVFGQVLSIAKDIHDAMDAATGDNKLAQQWMYCIKEKITDAIANSSLSDSLETLQQMDIKMNEAIIPSINDPYIDEDDDEEINRNLHDFRTLADFIRTKASYPGNPNPAAFLVPYDGALTFELSAAMLYITKLQESYDPKKLPGKLHDVGFTYRYRMNVYKKELEHIENESLKPFFDWIIHEKKEGYCKSGYLADLSFFKCSVIDYTQRTGRYYFCGEISKWKCWLQAETCKDVCTKCTPDSCDKEYQKRLKIQQDIKGNVRKKIQVMKGKVEKASKTFDDMVRHVKLT